MLLTKRYFFVHILFDSGRKLLSHHDNIHIPTNVWIDYIIGISSSNTISCSQIFEEAYAINYLLIYEHAKQCSGSGIY